MDVSRPIGVFDSGIGGLTVVRALMERLRKAMDPAGILNPERWKLP